MREKSKTKPSNSTRSDCDGAERRSWAFTLALSTAREKGFVI